MLKIYKFSEFQKKFILLENTSSPAQKIYDELKEASCSLGNIAKDMVAGFVQDGEVKKASAYNPDDLRKLAIKFTSKDIFDQVQELMKKNPICKTLISKGFSSIQELLNGKCQNNDLDVVTAFAGQLNRIPEIGMKFDTYDRDNGWRDMWRWATAQWRRAGATSTFKMGSVVIKTLTPQEQQEKKNIQSQSGSCSKQTVDSILAGLKKGCQFSVLSLNTGISRGTDEATLQKTAKLYGSRSCFFEVEKRLRASPIEGYKSLQELLNGELGVDDLDVVTSFQTQLEKIGIRLDYKRTDGEGSGMIAGGGGLSAAFVRNSIKINPGRENSVSTGSVNTSRSSGTTKNSTSSGQAKASNTSGNSQPRPSKDRCVKYRPKGFNQNVKLLQQKLKDLGFLAEEPDGKYGPKTQEAVRKFQEKYEIKPTYGCYGPVTAKKLKEIGGDYIPFYGDKQEYSK